MLTEEQKKVVFKKIKEELKSNPKNISRVTFLTFAFVRGFKYRKVEEKTNWDTQCIENGLRPGTIAANVFTHHMIEKIVSSLYDDYEGRWRANSKLSSEQKEEIEELIKDLSLRVVLDWFTEKSDEAVSGG